MKEPRAPKENVRKSGGFSDLSPGIIRAISRKNLQDDPLRLLWAYRFLAQGYGEPEEGTRQAIQELAPEIHRAAPERNTLRPSPCGPGSHDPYLL